MIDTWSSPPLMERRCWSRDPTWRFFTCLLSPIKMMMMVMMLVMTVMMRMAMMRMVAIMMILPAFPDPPVRRLRAAPLSLLGS